MPAPESGMVTSFKVAAGIGARPGLRSDRRMHRSCYDNFMRGMAPVEFPDKGAAGK